MSDLLQQFGQLGSSIKSAVEAEVERKAKSLLVVFSAEVQFHLAPVLAQIQAERRIADDRHETLNQKLDQVLEKLGTNGSGGKNG